MDSPHLYVYILQAKEISPAIIRSILSTPQPVDILELLVNKNGVDCLEGLSVFNENLWAGLKLVNPLPDIWLKRLFEYYFSGTGFGPIKHSM